MYAYTSQPSRVVSGEPHVCIAVCIQLHTSGHSCMYTASTDLCIAVCIQPPSRVVSGEPHVCIQIHVYTFVSNACSWRVVSGEPGVKGGPPGNLFVQVQTS